MPDPNEKDLEWWIAETRRRKTEIATCEHLARAIALNTALAELRDLPSRIEFRQNRALPLTNLDQEARVILSNIRRLLADV